MKNICGRLIGAVAVAALMMWTGTQMVSAQICNNANNVITIENNTGSTVDLTFYLGLSTYTLAVAPGTNNYTPPPFLAVGFISAKGNQVGAPGPWPACTGCITLKITGMFATVCAVICTDKTDPCGLHLNPVSPCPGNCQ